MNTSVKLSICIPTYNQPEALKRLLSEIEPQFNSFIEIIVQDDSNNDDSKLIVENFSKRMPIQYIKKVREGLDKALIELTEVATGEFIWWIGNDSIFESSIDTILEVTNRDPAIDFIWVNSCDITNPRKLANYNKESFYFKNSDDVIEKIDIGLLGFITATIFKREKSLDILREARKKIGSAFACMFIILYVISQNGKMYYLGKPNFSSQPKPSGEVRWYDQFQVFGINLHHIVIHFRDSFNQKILKRALAANLRMVIKAIIVERAMNLKTGFASPGPKIIPLLRTYWNYLDFWIAFPLLIIPTSISKVFYFIYKKLNNSAQIVELKSEK